MTREQIDMVIAEVFAGVFLRQLDVSRSVTREDTADWDFIKHMELVFAVESAAGIEFSEDEIANITSIDDFRRRLSAADAA